MEFISGESPGQMLMPLDCLDDKCTIQDLLKLYLYGYMNRIRSSRRLEAEFRRGNGEALKNVFKGFVKLCVKLGLYGKELLAIDGGKFKAVNSKDRNYSETKLGERKERLNMR